DDRVHGPGRRRGLPPRDGGPAGLARTWRRGAVARVGGVPTARAAGPPRRPLYRRAAPAAPAPLRETRIPRPGPRSRLLWNAPAQIPQCPGPGVVAGVARRTKDVGHLYNRRRRRSPHAVTLSVLRSRRATVRAPCRSGARCSPPSAWQTRRPRLAG